MAKKIVKKVDVKKVEKERIAQIVREALEAAGYGVADGVDYGFTAGTLVAKGTKVDVQIKPITPKAGVDRYEALEVEEVQADPVEEDDYEDVLKEMDEEDFEEELARVAVVVGELPAAVLEEEVGEDV